jgi:hypothetical protein
MSLNIIFIFFGFILHLTHQVGLSKEHFSKKKYQILKVIIVDDLSNKFFTDDNSSFIYVGLGIIVILVGIFMFNYYRNKNKQVRFKRSQQSLGLIFI